MLLSELDYDLPAELIAQQPAEPRDSARLLVLDRRTGAIEHRIFRDLASYLRPADCLVLNDTRVLPARFFCRRPSGARIEGLFLRERDGLWEVLLRPSRRLDVGEELVVGDHRFRLTDRLERGAWLIEPQPHTSANELLGRIGQTPLPPYIRAQRRNEHRAEWSEQDNNDYQTVYAARPGAVAAPTAGMHFTPELLQQIAAAGVSIAKITLHVGAGTFAPVEVEDLREHRMHAEQYEARADELALLERTVANEGRVVAVGTTTCRTLEAIIRHKQSEPGTVTGWTDLMILPPFSFFLTKALITNFHLPRSTLLALVMAFAGKELIREAYQAAVRDRYRFYSYGDAMLIV